MRYIFSIKALYVFMFFIYLFRYLFILLLYFALLLYLVEQIE